MGYHSLHPNPGLNFTLNRLAQTIPPEEVKSVAKQIDSLESWVSQMQAAGAKAEQAGRLVEEMYPLLDSFAAAGYTVLAFEGPGQGAALRTSNLPMPFDWEKPVSAILDHYSIESCTLIGMSLGGYLAPRAAAFEKRIKRVVSWGAMFDFFEVYRKRLGKAQFAMLGKLLDLGLSGVVDKLINKAREKEGILDWAVSHGMHVSGTSTPYDYLRWVKSLNLRDCAHLVDQDVLLMIGAEDHLVPVEQLYVQAAAMHQARSVTSIMFTARDDAAQHCQVGNTTLAVEQILDWLSFLEKRDCASRGSNG